MFVAAKGPRREICVGSDQFVPSAVIAGLDPAIHHLREDFLAKKMDARVKPAHDQSRAERMTR
jgi:hypothetical protein